MQKYSPSFDSWLVDGATLHDMNASSSSVFSFYHDEKSSNYLKITERHLTSFEE